MLVPTEHTMFSHWHDTTFLLTGNSEFPDVKPKTWFPIKSVIVANSCDGCQTVVQQLLNNFIVIGN